MSIQKLHVSNNVFVRVYVCVCMIPTRSIEEIFDLEGEQRGRDARFAVYLSCYCLQPKHVVVQRLWQSLSWVWMKDEEMKKGGKTQEKGAWKKKENRTEQIINISYLLL